MPLKFWYQKLIKSIVSTKKEAITRPIRGKFRQKLSVTQFYYVIGATYCEVIKVN